MANRNATPNYTFEQWRVEFNNLSDDLGDFNTGIIGSVPSGTNTHVTAENAVTELIHDIDSIIDGTHQFTGDITFQSDVHVVGDLSLDGNITIGNQTSDTLTITAELDSNLIPDVHNTYDVGSALKGWRNLHVATEATLASAKVSDLTSGRIVYAGTDGELQDDTDLTFDGSTLTTTNINVGTSATLASAQVSDLTSGRIVLAGTSGELQDDSSLTFSGTTLSVPDISISSTATLASAQVSDLTAGRIVLAGTSGELEDNSNLTFNGTLLNVAGDISNTGDVTVGQDLGVGTDLTVTGNTYLQSTTGSTDTSSGALIVTGGAGIGENLYVGGNVVSTGSVFVNGGDSLASESFSIAISVALG